MIVITKTKILTNGYRNERRDVNEDGNIIPNDTAVEKRKIGNKG